MMFRCLCLTCSWLFMHAEPMTRTTVKNREPKPEHLRIGATIREMRTMRGMSQDELSRAALVSRSYIANAEVGRYRPSDKVLARIASALHVPQISIIATSAEEPVALKASA